jgi:very-short-patch-repair endonuclease
MAFDIAAKIEQWRGQLLDTSKRNRLIKFTTGRSGGVGLTHPGAGRIWTTLFAEEGKMLFARRHELLGEAVDEGDGPGRMASDLEEDDGLGSAVRDDLARCLRSPRLREGDLLCDMADKALATRLNRMALDARTSITEMGVTTLHVSFGLLRWYESPTSQVVLSAPLILLPARLGRQNVESRWSLRLEDQDVISNHSLAQLLLNDFGIKLPPVPDDVDPGDPEARVRYFDEVRRAIREVPRWAVLDEVALGIFAFQKVAMWEDLGRNRDKIAAHGLCRAIAGDHSARPEPPGGLPSARELDRSVRPEHTFHILDADSSQHEAIVAVGRGASLILDGPPGTGKSQTIANVIAEALAAGKTVLFVSEKAAALEVVKRRLDGQGLGDFCLECHSQKASKKAVVAELGRCLSLAPELYPDHSEDLARLFEARAGLNAYVRALHEPRSALNLSPFEIHGRLAEVAEATPSRCTVPGVFAIDAAQLRRMGDLLVALADCRGAIDEHDRHPWRGCRVTTDSLNRRDDAEHHLGRLAKGLVAVEEATPLLARLGFVPESAALDAWSRGLELAREATAYPLAPSAWFEGDPRQAASAHVELDRASRAYREARAELPEFSEEAIRTLVPVALEAFGKAGDAPLSCLAAPPMPTVRARHAQVGGIADGLASLADRILSFHEGLRTTFDVLGTPGRPLAMEWFPRIVELLRLAVRLRTVRRDWLDPAHRQELRQVVERCREDAAANGAARASLLARLVPRAFDTEAAPLAARAASFAPFWKRLLPGWWSYRAGVASLYIQGRPDTVSLFRDMGELAAYRRREDYGRDVRGRYAAGLILDGAGEPDWQLTLDGIAEAERLDPLIKLVPELREALDEGGRLDRDALADSVNELGRLHGAFREAFEAAGRRVDLAGALGSDPMRGKMLVEGFVAWFRSEAEGFAARAADLGRVVAALRDGQDLAIDLLPARSVSSAALRGAWGRLIGSHAEAGHGGADAERTEDRDWGDLADLGEWTLGFLDRHGDRPPAYLVRAATDPLARRSLIEAVRGNEAAQTPELAEGWAFAVDLFPIGEEVSTGIVLDRAPIAELAAWAAQRAGDAHRLREWVRLGELAGLLGREGLSPILGELIGRRFEVDRARDAFLGRYYREWLDAAHAADETLRRFGTDAHERLVEEFRSLDRASIRTGRSRIRQKLLGDPARPSGRSGDAPGTSELGTLMRESSKKARHLPLRKLFARTPMLLLRLKPCLMMSPLAVSTYLDSDELRFDLVIFDEASQVRPYDAISAIYRGRQLVVAGDEQQLPPTNFFARSDGGDDLFSEEEEETEDSLRGIESILGACGTIGLPRRRLRWHYRSRREPLIAFSNRHFYDNELVTFPGAHNERADPAIRFEFVADGLWKTGKSGGFNAVEARRVAELVFAHFRAQPRSSLGVIAFNQRQQVAIIDELEAMRAAAPAMESFFDESRDESFFVKNLENVQGDERDTIFLSVGYGPDENGRVAMRFGPLNRDGGERRLNVAITRARSAMTVVSSMRAAAIDVGRTPAHGARLLRAYLDFAERGVEALRSEITEDGQRDFDSPFEREVSRALERRGMSVHRQVGCGGFRIDLALVDPARPGRYVVGVECDGATYHSAATARDRDRLRQQVLEDLDWSICRIWSTDWFRDPGGQVDRVLAAYERARRDIDQPTGTPEPQVSAEPEPPIASPEPLPVQPTIHLASLAYRNIDEVPHSVIREKLLDSLRQFGSTEDGDLAKEVTRQLGFKRTGDRIKQKIGDCVESLIREGKIGREQDRLLIVAPRANVSR